MIVVKATFLPKIMWLVLSSGSMHFVPDRGMLVE